MATREVLRSAARGELLVPWAHLDTVQRRAFSVVGPSASGGSRSSSKGGRFIYFIFRVARCPVFSRTVRYFGPLSGIRIIVIPDNASVNSSIFCATNIDTDNVRYFLESHLVANGATRFLVFNNITSLFSFALINFGSERLK